MKHKWLSGILAAVVVISLFGCGASDGSDGGDGGDYEQVTFAYATMNNVPTEKGLSSVQDAVNKITREKIGVEVTLKPITLSDYSQSVSRSLQGGEKIDLFQSIYDFSNCVSTGMGLDITELIDKYAPETKDVVGEEWLKACTVDGKLYSVPVYKPTASRGYFVCRQDVLEAAGVDLSGVDSSEDLTEIFEKVKAQNPDMTMLAPLEQGRLGETLSWQGVDYLSDSDTGAYGVLIGNDMEVKNLYESDMFVKSCTLARDWYEAGYIMKDAATTASTVSELMSSGNYFGQFTGNPSSAQDLAGQLSAIVGYPMTAVGLSEPYLSTSAINMVSMMIASNTEVPEAAMKFLNLLYTDPDVINQIIFGIEDRDYELDENGFAVYPEGQDSTTVPYTNQMDNGIMGNAFIMHPLAGTSEQALEEGLKANQTAAVSPAMGFIFDNSSVSVQYTAVSNVKNQYLPGLLCGSVDPETEIDAFNAALYEAGLQDIIDAKQEQLDQWLEENR